MSSTPLRLLIITPLDWEQQPNNIEHNRVVQYRARGVEVCVLFKVMNRSARLRDLLIDTLMMRFADHPLQSGEAGARIVAVDPFFNYCAGLRKNAEEIAEDAPARRGLRAIRLLAPLALLRDVFFVPCFTLAALWKLRGRFDACLGVGPWGAATGWVLRGLGRTTLLVCEDHDYEPGLVPPGLRRHLFAALERFTLRRADLIVSIGHLLAARRREDLGCDPHVIPSGVEWAKFAPARASGGGGAQAELRIVYVGNVVSWSGIDHALEVLPDLPQATLKIVGDGLPNYVARLRSRAAALGCSERVVFLGRRPPEELPALLATADVGLASSQPNEYRRYASPLKVMEYMAAGVPVVATTGTEAADIVARAEAGVAALYDAGALRVALAELAADPERRARMAARGIEFARTVDWKVLVERELALIDERLRLAHGGRRQEVTP